MLCGSNTTGLDGLLNKALESELGDMDIPPFEQTKRLLDIQNMRSILEIRSKLDETFNQNN